jgi:hypothetical protein
MFGRIIKETIASNQLARANGTLFHITARYVKLALHYSAIMAGMRIGAPVGMLVAITDPWNGSPFQRVRMNPLSGDDLFRPTFNHWNAAEQDALWCGHWKLSRRVVSMPFLPSFLEFWKY